MPLRADFPFIFLNLVSVLNEFHAYFVLKGQKEANVSRFNYVYSHKMAKQGIYIELL